MRQQTRVAVFGRADLLPDTPGYAEAYIAMKPRAGTMAEVANLWALRKAGHVPPRPFVLVGPAWAQVASQFEALGTVDANLLEWSVRVPGPREAVKVVREAYQEERAHG